MKLRYENSSPNKTGDVPVYTNKDGVEFILKTTYTNDEIDSGEFQIVTPRCGGYILISGYVEIKLNHSKRSVKVFDSSIFSVDFYHQDLLSKVSFDFDYNSYVGILPENLAQVLSDLVADKHYIEWDAEEMPTIHQMKKEGY